MRFVKRDLPARQRGKRQFLHHRLWHAGEVGKLVDHAADIVNLAADDRQIFGEVLACRLVLRTIFAAQAVSGKLDRGQRVLDFMRDPPRDIRPGRLSLGREQIGDIIEGDDIADDLPVNPLGGDLRP